MAIITVSRELAALGDETVAELVKVSGYRFVDKAAIEKHLLASGLSQRSLERFDERKPGVFSSLSQERDDYLHYLRLAIYEEAEGGGCVLMGRGAAFVLREVPGVFSLRLVADMNVRIERVKSYFQCDAKRAAQILERSDHDRDGFHHYFFDAEWNAASSYHMVLNMARMHPAHAARLINSAVNASISDEDKAAGVQRLQELKLSHEVATAVLYVGKLPIHFLEVQSNGGLVTLYGVTSSQATVEAAVEISAAVHGVTTVQSEIQIVQEYSVMP
jgi:cytidylate kinase